MPAINRFECDKCDFKLPSGWGGHMYVSDQAGNRIVCPHPAEYAKAYQVLGGDASWELIEQRTGFNSVCLCRDCLQIFHLDLKRDARTCLNCRSSRVASLEELVGGICPKCMIGTIQEIETGRWC